MRHYGDITKINGAKVPVVDTVIFGAPCQDLSVAGKRAGMKHTDLGDEESTRSGLFMEAVRIIKEMRSEDERNGRTDDNIRPRYAVYENVPGAFSSNKGEDFRIVLEEIAKVADKDASIPMPDKGKWTNYGCIVGDGWSIAWRVLDAQFWGVPQRRRRIALVADFGGQSAPEILFVRKSVSRDTVESKPKRKEASSDASRGFGADDRLGADQYNAVILGDTVSTLGVNCGMSHGRQCVLEPQTAYTMQDREGCAGGGKGALIQEDKSASLRTNNFQYVFQPVYSVENHPNDSRVGINEDGIVQALTSRMGTGGGNVPLVMESKSNFIDVELEVAVRKYEVNKDLLQECLRDHKGNFTNKEIAEALGKPLTLVEHWFRRDNSFAIPDPDIWLELKELLGIETTKFDQSIMEFEVKGSNYDMRNRIHIGNTVPTLTCGSGNTLHLLPMVLAIDTSHADDVVRMDDIVSPLQARDYKGGKLVYALDRASYNQGKNAQFDFEVSDKGINSPLVAKGPGHKRAVCYSVDQGGGKSSVDVREDKAPTLTTTHDGAPAVCYWDGGQVAGTLTANNAGGNQRMPDKDNFNCVITRYIVRRLTPLECERLQGYPDGWTDIGEWTDSNGKKKQTSDAARYKALGNSIALPPWKWVLKRLCACYERDATMASLFDGIGGFPYLWEQLNGKGSCLWASEIEEFPIAVTKLRIGEI